MNILQWLDKNLEKVILCIFLSIMIIVMGIQVIARYVFNSSLSWSEELARYLFIWSAFLSLPYTIRYDNALKINHLLTVFPENIKRIINMIANILIVVFFTFMFFNASTVVKLAIDNGQKSAALRLPMYIVQGSSALAFILTTVRSLQFLVIDIKKFNLKKTNKI